MKCVFRCLLWLMCLFPLPAAGENVRFSLVYTSDTHGYIATDPDTIGLDRIAGLRQSLPAALLLDAGDFLHGLPLINLDQGASVVRLMKEAGYFAAALGNHEFSHGQPALARRLKEAAQEPGLHLLSANTRTESGDLLAEAWTETELEGVRICLFGLTTPETYTAASPSAVKGLSFEDPLETAQTMAGTLRKHGCSFIVALTHLGSTSRTEVTSLALGRSVPDIDVIIDGHSHLELEKRDGSGPLVVSPGAHGKRLGRLDVGFDTASGTVISLDNRLLTPADLAAVTPDRTLARAIEDLRLKESRLMSRVVARSAVSFPGDAARNRTQETALGDLCADALRDAYKTTLAIVNGGGIRAPLDRGPVRLGDVNAVLAFGGYAVSVKVTGRELRDILEQAYSALPAAGGGFAQISGFSVRLQPSNPPGSRVVNIVLPSGPVRDDRLYTLAVNDFLAEGGDNCPHLAGKSRLQMHTTMQDALIAFLARADTRRYAAPQGRIVMEP